ncbi:MAG: hypothetical protein ACR5KV_01890 [Wolbachia sp.]
MIIDREGNKHLYILYLLSPSPKGQWHHKKCAGNVVCEEFAEIMKKSRMV